MSKFLEALEAATEEDVAEIEKQIEECDVKGASLRSALRILRTKLGGDEPKAPKAPKPEGVGSAADESDLVTKRKKVNLYLRANGSKSTQKLCETCGIYRAGRNNITTVLKHEWFRTNPDGMVELTPKGDAAALI